MLNNLNPSLVLELTATPRQTSNILSYVGARELKKENMVKLPVVVWGRILRQPYAQVNFELATGEVYRVDIQAEGEAVPKYKKATKSESEFIRQYLERFPKEKRIKQCTHLIAGQINRNNRYATKDVEDYVQRVVQNMTDDELALMETAIPVYANKIQKKIDSLEEAYRLKQFKKWLDSGRIICKDSYCPADVITPAETTDSIPYSLYEAEKDDMNNFERQVIDTVVGTDNDRWWHRIIERKDFCLNGWMHITAHTR